MMLDESVRTLKGVGEKTEKNLQKLHIYNISELLHYFPRTYIQYPDCIKDESEIHIEQKNAFSVIIHKPAITKKTSKMTIAMLSCSSFNDFMLEAVWFRMPYISSALKVNQSYVLYGVCKRESTSSYKLEQPEIFPANTYIELKQKLQPIYSLTKGITNSALKKLTAQALSNHTFLNEYLPSEILQKRSLLNYANALQQIHFPDSKETYLAARNRLAYNEFFDFFMQIKQADSDSLQEENNYHIKETSFYDTVRKNLPFSLTNGQEHALNEIQSDFLKPYITQRLIQGDVGSGKTLIAFLSMLLFAENGYQSLIMAPTEVLARQHYQTFCEYISQYQLPFSCVLLTGSITGKKRKEIYEQLRTIPNLFIVGTNALLSDGLQYHKLGLVITDEQHRFGVHQRNILKQKGSLPFVLVMSATPIPRTLAMILYQNMLVSIIEDLPKNRLAIKNCVIKNDQRKKAIKFILKEIKKGHQCYIICPLVEASEMTEAENVTDYIIKIKELLPASVSISSLHGKMSSKDKNEIMERFASNEIQLLISTTVVEVGVNVANATVMMIENANRFGLAQLHQLRGRVGRGSAQSYCIFMDASSEKQNKRLDIMNHSNDGFYIANEDLKLRGPGDVYGIRQSGDFDFQIGDIYQDSKLLSMASEDVNHLLAEDPSLCQPNHKNINKHMKNIHAIAYTNL